MKSIVLLAMLCLAAGACTHAEAPVQDPPQAAAPVLHLPHLGHPQPGVYTSGRLQAGDVAQLQAAGVRHVIDLTRDSESPGFDEAAAMRAAGIAYDQLPIAGADSLTRANVQAFDALLRDSQGPVLVHCASSNRVGAMAALRAAWVEGMPAEDAISEGKAWGLESLEAAVRARLEEPR